MRPGPLNHACRPNTAIDFEKWELYALRHVSPGEELGWNYLTTEWKLSCPFECGCGAATCGAHDPRIQISVERSADGAASPAVALPPIARPPARANARRRGVAYEPHCVVATRGLPVWSVETARPRSKGRRAVPTLIRIALARSGLFGARADVRPAATGRL